MDDNKRIIEVGGVKLEVDLRHATVIDNFRVGDNVKVLVKKYGDSYESHPGVIIGFDNFKERPTIVIAYFERGYGAEVKMLYLNKDSKDVEVAGMNRDELVLDKQDCLDAMDRQITAKQAEIADLKSKREFFLRKFGQYFEASEAISRAIGS